MSTATSNCSPAPWSTALVASSLATNSRSARVRSCSADPTRRTKSRTVGIAPNSDGNERRAADATPSNASRDGGSPSTITPNRSSSPVTVRSRTTGGEGRWRTIPTPILCASLARLMSARRPLESMKSTSPTSTMSGRSDSVSDRSRKASTSMWTVDASISPDTDQPDAVGVTTRRARDSFTAMMLAQRADHG